MDRKPIIAVQEMLGDEYYELMEQCLDDGWFYSGDDACVGAIVCDEAWLSEQNLNKNLDKVWYVSFYAGDLKRILELIPFDLKWVCFKRIKENEVMKIYDMQNLKRKLGVNHG